MNNNLNPFFATDGYKISHYLQYPEGTTLVYSNFTPRSSHHADYIRDVDGNSIDYVISFGQQLVIQQIKEMFDEHFFKRDTITGMTTDEMFEEGTEHSENAYEEYFKENSEFIKDRVCGEIKKEYSLYLGTDYDVSHIEALWDLGYLPIVVKALPEGTKVPIGVPLLTIYNTLPEFYWLTNFLETLLSNLLWKPITSATIAYQYKQNLMSWARKTDKTNVAFVDFQGHDFSMRGLSGVDSVIASGLGHATSFKGSDSIPVIYGARKFYGEEEFVVGSVNATEHSVMSAGGEDSEIDTFRFLMKQFPTGVLSIVSDTWNLWDVLTKYLPKLKEEILSRDGKIVIRPDSGDPVDIICGLNNFKEPLIIEKNGKWFEWNGITDWNIEVDYHPKFKGVIELLWDVFGGTTNEQGYKILDPHIGAIYGDSITIERANDICRRLEAKGFASTNIVLGIGSYTYQYNTRDTFGMAMKATYVEIEQNVEAKKRGGVYTSSVVGKEIFKDPITDDGSKKSAKGLLCVVKGHEKPYVLLDQIPWEEEEQGELQTIFKDGKAFNVTTLTEIRAKLNS